jgi:hypothetical protein
MDEIGMGKCFLSRTQVAQQQREILDKQEYMKLKTSAEQKKWSLN